MGTSRRSQSLRGPGPCYGKLQETQGRPLEGRLRRALSLRQGHEKPRLRGLDGSVEGQEAPAQERPPGTLGDTERLIEAQQGNSRRWLRQYQQVRRRWQSFVSSLPGVTLSRPTSPEHPLDITSCKP
uniref:uncharacterized protein C11orf86 homolog isoform X2 n=1 Tax=Jaculus jaculus TaxID=51337 RepID=UPI001E1B5590|nr:uncharacterized protein C11orf86 homolog isoform X2 [Jaculus jaculus]